MTETAAEARTLGELASLVRSKNAGPFWVTLDVFFADDEAYARAAGSGAITADRIAELYRVDAAQVEVFALPHIRVIKVSFPRREIQGTFTDRDMHSGQQHVVLERIVIP